MDIFVIGLLLISIGLIFKMILESKTEIDGLVKELEDIQDRIENSITQTKKRTEKNLKNKYVHNTVLANGEVSLDTNLPATPYTLADHN